MKKTFKTLFVAALSLMALASCEDVPAPYTTPGGGGEEDTTTVVEGTPVTCVEAAAIAQALEDKASTTKTYTVTGYITQTNGTVSNNQQTFWMADEKGGSNVFEAYWANIPSPYTALTVGTKVKITGTIMRYGTVSEIKNATVEVLETGDGGEVAEGTPATCAEAAAIGQALEDKASTTESYTITGYITNTDGTVSNNQQTFWMADAKDGGKVFEAYWANIPSPYTALTVGTKVKVTGTIMRYGTISEIKNGAVEILEAGESGEDTPSSDAKHITIAEFLSKADASTTYELTGTVANIANTTYGNFDLVENGSSIYIYGLLDKSGATKNFASLSIEEGDEVTLTGVYTEYNGKAEIKNAQFVSVKKGSGNSGSDTGSDTPTTGDNYIANGDFETWADGLPTGWKSASSASSATLSQSTDAHAGSYSCSVATGNSSNKRLAYKEITLPAGTYQFTFYAKASSSTPCQTRAGYVPVTDGSVGSYVYGDYADLSTSSWTLVTYEFTLEATTTLCPVIMNPKNSSYSTAQAILIDDAKLVKK